MSIDTTDTWTLAFGVFRCMGLSRKRSAEIANLASQEHRPVPTEAEDTEIANKFNMTLQEHQKLKEQAKQEVGEDGFAA